MKSLIALYTMSMLVFFLGVLPAHSETGQLVMYQSGEETVGVSGHSERSGALSSDCCISRMVGTQ